MYIHIYIYTCIYTIELLGQVVNERFAQMADASADEGRADAASQRPLDAGATVKVSGIKPLTWLQKGQNLALTGLFVPAVK